MDTCELLDTKIIAQHNAVVRVRRWWRGVHPDKGVITQGLTGWETVEEAELFPYHTIAVDNQPLAAGVS